MLVSGKDERNISVALDLLQMKMIVNALRLLTTRQLVETSIKLQRDGFKVTGDDILAATLGFSSVFGQFVDGMITVEQLAKEQAQAQVQPQEPTSGDIQPDTAVDDEEVAKETKKTDWVN